MKRFAAFFLLVAIMLSVVPVSAATSGSTVSASEVLYDTASVDQWNAYFSDVVFGELTNSVKWAMLNTPVAAAGIGSLSSYQALSNAESKFLYKHRDIVSNPTYAVIKILIDGKAISPAIQYDESLGVHRLIDERSGLWIVSSSGAFPYFREKEVEEGSQESSLGGQWIPYREVSWAMTNVVNEVTLYDMGAALKEAGQKNTVQPYKVAGVPKYQYIRSAWTAGAVGDYYVYCDSNGRPYVYRPDPDQWAIDDSNNYYTDNDGDNIFDDGEPVEDQLINIENNTLTLPDGTMAFINNLIYDESTKTYYVDAHQEYDIDNNTYITNNYHYEYHINYTSITYIGQTEEYDEVYELYYQLPDGRSSADLTADELLALNTGIDVLPYIRSADDVSIRALYHFDADTLDSSYWSHLGEFTWNKGSSITYMDAGAFNGALYLDETDHEFQIKLPSNLGTSDFTVQFRLYQSGTIAPQTDSSISIGGTTFLQFDGESIEDGSGTVLSPVSVGNWQEIALMRSGSVVYVFHNGVQIGTVPYSSGLGDTLTFVFGGSQQTYKYFDELRVVSKALYSPSGYTPTSVPFDTNLSLVLPDSQLPVADEYWSIISSHENLLQDSDLADWRWKNLSALDSVYVSSVAPKGNANYPIFDFTSVDVSRGNKFVFPEWGYRSALTDIVSEDSSYFISNSYTNNTATAGLYTFPAGDPTGKYNVPSYGMFTAFGIYYQDGSMYVKGADNVGDYTFSMVDAEGNVGSLTFSVKNTFSANVATSISFNGYRISYGPYTEYFADDRGRAVYLAIQPESYDTPPGSFVYWELVKGTSTDLTAEFVQSVVAMGKDDLNTPSLAVRTDLEITGYQIGGVRPSLPEKGLVWALVEGGRITSLQIYNGQAWEAVDGRIWTGARWVPYYAYDVLLLKDLYDIVEGDPSLDYIYTQEGFWAWLQQAWGQMMGKLDQIINALGGSTNDPASDCPHVYDSKVGRESSCSEPGHTIYTCSLCGHTYTELIDAHGHDWVVTNSVPDVLDEEGNVIEEGYDELTCSVCDAQSRDYGEGPEEVDLFDALGDFIADGITWILDKLTELADSLKTITETFNSFIEKVKGLAGGFPLFFGAFMALIPEDLQTIFWFAVIGFVVLAVWKKWSD